MDHTLGRLLQSPGLLVPGAFLLGLVIFVHELGHFIAAKAVGVRVLRFSMGFGPRLAGFTRGNTEYWLSWIPLGGYVQMAGDTPGDDGHMPAGPDEFLSHPWPGRLLIAVAGPFANLITALVIMFVVALTGVQSPDYPNVLGATPDTSVAYQTGAREGDRVVAVAGKPVKSWVEIFVANSGVSTKKPVSLTLDRAGASVPIDLAPEAREPFFSSLRLPEEPPVVGTVLAGMPAYKAGVAEGDRILAVNGDPVTTWSGMRTHISARADHPIRLTIRRGERTLDLDVTPVNSTGARGGSGQIGIEPPSQGMYVERHSLVESAELAFFGTTALVVNVYRGMWLTISRPLYYREYLGGPMFIAQAATEQAKRGLSFYLQFIAMINIAIMAFNLMPLPVLDGGHIVLALLEAVRRRAISARAYLNFQKVGLVLLGSLFILILANDPIRVIQRRLALDRASHPAKQEKTVVPSSP
jgi:regulator of sigma E protease